MRGPRFPFPIPFGWFQVGFKSDLAPGKVEACHYFGRDLVLWCEEDGTPHLQDAFCPHLGAHLGRGGSVEGGRLRCPFHGWKFDATGRCAEIPYAKRVPENANLRSYPLAQIGGHMMAWFHEAGDPPSFDLPEVPELDDERYSVPYNRSWEIKTIAQEMGENSFDPAHFLTIHGHPEIGTPEKTTFEGTGFSMLSKQVFPSSRGPVDARIDVYQWGPGFSLNRYSGLVDAIVVGTPTPIDTETTINRFSIRYFNPNGDPRVARIGDAFAKEVSRQFEQDIPIWENKRYVERPLLQEIEQSVLDYRRWYEQFYVRS